MFTRSPAAHSSEPRSVTESEQDSMAGADDWDAIGILVFATSLLSLGGSAVFLLLRVAGILS